MLSCLLDKLFAPFRSPIEFEGRARKAENSEWKEADTPANIDVNRQFSGENRWQGKNGKQAGQVQGNWHSPTSCSGFLGRQSGWRKVCPINTPHQSTIPNDYCGDVSGLRQLFMDYTWRACKVELSVKAIDISSVKYQT